MRQLWVCLFLLLTCVPGRLRAQHDALFRHIDSIATTRYSQSIRLCDSLLKTVSTVPEKGILHRLRGKTFYFSGEYAKASHEYGKAIALLRSEHSETDLGLTLLEQARLFRKMKLFDEAITVYSRAEALFSRLQDSAHLSTVWNEWGVVYELQEKYARAIRLYQQSLQMKMQLHDSEGIAYAHSFIATSELGLAHYDKAAQHGLYALGLFEQLGDPFPVALQSADLGALYFKQKDYSRALAYYNRSDSLASLWNYKELRAANYQQLAELYRESGHLDSAYTFFQKATALKDSVFTENTQKAIAELNARFTLAEKDAALQKKQAERDRAFFITLLTTLLLLLLGIVSFFALRQQRLRNRALIKEHFYKEALAHQENEQRLAEQRGHISRELHDNIGSYLTFISSSIDRIESPELRVHPKILNIRELTQETIVELRKTVWLLNRPALTAFEWQIKLQEYYRRFPEISIVATAATEGIKMHSEQATHLFRIVQEAINNALKYSGANEIRVQLDADEAGLSVEVQDNGIGFHPETVVQGFGMTTMRQRTEELGGTFVLESAPGKGSRVVLHFPFTGTAAA